MSANDVRKDFVNVVKERQVKRRWLGARVWRVGRLYDIVGEDVEGNRLDVVDVAADQPEDWPRDLFCSLGLKVEQEPPRPKKEAERPKVATITGRAAEVKAGIMGMLGEIFNKR